MINKLQDMKEIIRYKISSPKIMSNYVKVEISASCNARCVWCWMFKSPVKPQGLMKFEDFKRFVDINRTYFLAHKTGIMPFFNGECLIHPEIFKFLDYIISNKIKLMDLDTNLAMNIDIPRLLAYPFKAIRVNIGGASEEVHKETMKTDFNIVVENLKQAFKIDPDRIYVKMVVTKLNYHQIDQMKEFVRSLGGRADNVIIAPTDFPLPALVSDQDRRDFFNEVVSEDIKEYLKFDYDASKPDYDIRAREKKCKYLLNCVTYDGKLTICCQDQFEKINLGNAFETPMIDLVSTPEYKDTVEKAKNMGFDFCKECN